MELLPEEAFRCEHCFRQFANPFELQVHTTVCHHHVGSGDSGGKSAAALVCHICEVSFTSTEAFLGHMIAKHGTPDCPYECRVCMYRSSLYQDVWYHYVKVDFLVALGNGTLYFFVYEGNE